MEPDGLPLSYLLTSSLEGLENFRMRRLHEAAEIEREIKRKHKELIALRAEAQRLWLAAELAAWLERNREELLRGGEERVA